MRMAFGLVSLLICMGIIAMLYSSSLSTISHSGVVARDQAQQIAGFDANAGGRVGENVKFEPYQTGSKFQYLFVKQITPGSSYQTYYGLQAGDYIDEIGPQRARDTDADTAKALALEAYQRQWQLGIWRNNKHFLLPDQKAQANPLSPTGQPVAGTPDGAGVLAPTTPPAPRPVEQYQNPITKPLDAILNHDQ